jgi:GNAT superfamily N-acetyltransferase
LAEAIEARSYAVDVPLADGGLIHIRAIRPDDKQRLLELFHSLSDRSVYYRFFSQKRGLSPAELDYLTGVDFQRHVALVAVLPPTPHSGSLGPADQEERFAGVGRYVVQGESRAEVAYAVTDDQQHRGIGSALLQHMAAIARAAGITTFVADVLIENLDLHRAFLARSGFCPTATLTTGVAHISFPLGAGEHK